MDQQTIVRELEQELRVNSALRHRLGIEGGVDNVSSTEDGPPEAVAFTDKDGKTWALAVLEQVE